MKKVEHWADSIRVLYTLMVAISEIAVCRRKDQTHLIFAGLIRYGSWAPLNKIPVRSTIILWMIFNQDFFYHTLHVYHFRKKKNPKYVTVGLNMFLHV